MALELEEGTLHAQFSYGRRPIIIHSIEGSDVLESVCEHLAASARSAQRLIDLANLAADRLNRQAPLKADPVDDYLATWPARRPLREQIPEPAQM
jgi:hypothetical protein